MIQSKVKRFRSPSTSGKSREDTPSLPRTPAKRIAVAGPAPGVAALERGLAILGAFGGDAGTLSLAELAGATGLYKSTILRLCTSLLRLGYMQRLADGRYRLGPTLFLLGRQYQQSFRLGELVQPVLRDLVERSGETASFYVRDGDHDTCLFRHESPRRIRDAGVAAGDRFPIDDSAGSRVLSAFLGAPGPRAAALRRQVVVVVKRSQRVPGASAVVCPVFGVDQKLTGTLVLSGPQARFTEPAAAAMRSAILEQAAALTRALGGDAAVFGPTR